MKTERNGIGQTKKRLLQAMAQNECEGRIRVEIHGINFQIFPLRIVCGQISSSLDN